MALTTTTTLATVVPAEFIVAEILQEVRPHNVVAPLVLNDIQPHGQGLTWNKSSLPTTTAASVGESADITAAARTTTEVTITIAEVGLSTDVTDLSNEVSRLNDQLIEWGQSQGRAIAQKLTGDLCALFAALGGSAAVGTSGVNFTLANIIEAIYRLDNSDAVGDKKCVLHPIQILDLSNAITSSGASVMTNLAEVIREGRLPGGTPATGFWGELFGVPIYQTTEVDTANSGADRAGAMFCRDAMGFVQLRPIRVEYDRDASARVSEVVATTAYGVGEVRDTFGVPIITDA